MTDFHTQAAMNSVYGNLYGEQTMAHSYKWAGTQGDIAAQNRMSSPNVDPYYEGPDYNMFLNNQIATGSLGQGVEFGFQMEGVDDFTPKTQYKVVNYSGSGKGEILTFGLVFMGALLLILLMSK